MHYGGKRAYTCKSIPNDDVTKSLGKPVEWKFQDKSTVWHQIETIFDTDQVIPLIRAAGGTFDVEENFSVSLASFDRKLSESLIFLDGEPLITDDTFEAHLKRKKIRITDSTIVQGSIFLPCVCIFFLVSLK